MQPNRSRTAVAARRIRWRRGVTMVETAVVLGACLIMILGMLDLSLAVISNNIVTDAARRLAREAAMHGAMAGPHKNSWGTTKYSGTASDNSEVGTCLRQVLGPINPSQVSVQVEWLDGGNEVDDRVRVTIDYQHKCVIPITIYGTSLNLQAVSTMRIAH